MHYLSECVQECIHPLPFLLQSNRTCTAECPPGLIRHNFSCVEKCPKEARYVENQTCVANCADQNSLSLVTIVGYRCIISETCINETILMKDSRFCVSICPNESHIIVKNACANISDCRDVYVDTKQGYKCSKSCPDTLYTNGRRCVNRCPPNKMIMDRNCTDMCFGKKPLKMDEQEFRNSANMDNNMRFLCMSECPKGYAINGNKCINFGRCAAFGKPYIFNNTCHEKCPPGMLRRIFEKNFVSWLACVAFEHAKFWFVLVFSVLIIFSVFFGCFAMICCFKGSTRLSRSMAPPAGRSEVNLMFKYD